MKRKYIITVILLLIFCSSLALALHSVFLSLPEPENEMKQEINNSLDYMIKNNQTYLGNPMLMSLWVTCKKMLGTSFDEQSLITYFNLKQQIDGTWGDMFTTHRVQFALYMMNSEPVKSLDEYLSTNLDTWEKVIAYSNSHHAGDVRDNYHILTSWMLNFHQYPSWIDDFFNFVESDLSWTTASDYHKRTHILYSYVLARHQFPNLDDVVSTTITERETDGHWEGSQYSFNTPIYFTAIQITLLKQILQLYPTFRTEEINQVLVETQDWVTAQYHTQIVEGKVCGYFGDSATISIENTIWCGLLATGQNGLLSLNVDMTFQSIVDEIIPEYTSILVIMLLATLLVVLLKKKMIKNEL